MTMSRHCSQSVVTSVLVRVCIGALRLGAGVHHNSRVVGAVVAALKHQAVGAASDLVQPDLISSAGEVFLVFKVFGHAQLLVVGLSPLGLLPPLELLLLRASHDVFFLGLDAKLLRATATCLSGEGTIS